MAYLLVAAIILSAVSASAQVVGSTITVIPKSDGSFGGIIGWRAKTGSLTAVGLVGPDTVATPVFWKLPNAPGVGALCSPASPSGDGTYQLYWNCTGSGGTGISSLNGLTGTAQTFATPGTSGTAPNWNSTGTVHTLNIPMASGVGVTAGLISKATYDLIASSAGAFTASSPLVFASSVLSCPTCIAFFGGSATTGQVPMFHSTSGLSLEVGYSVSTAISSNTLVQREVGWGINAGPITAYPGTAVTGLQVRRGTSGQISAIQTWATETGVVVASVDATGYFTGKANLTSLLVTPPATFSGDNAIIARRGSATQTVPIQVWVDQLGLPLSWIEVDGSFTGRANTALALSVNPLPCPVGQFVNDTDANGTLHCSAIAGASGDVLGPATNSDLFFPQWNGANSKTLSNGAPGSSFNVPNSVMLRDAFGSTTVFNLRVNVATLGDISTSSQVPLVIFESLAGHFVDFKSSDGVTILSFIDHSGAFAGNAATSSTLDHNPSPCAAGGFVNDTDADGTLHCSTPAGGGTITGVFGSAAGIYSLSGGASSGSVTLALGVSGIAGGLPYFSTNSLINSSSALALNAPILGGGPGGAPSSGSRSGNTITFMTLSGGVGSAGNCPQWDGLGNLTAGGSCSGVGGAITGVFGAASGIFSLTGGGSSGSITLTLGVSGISGGLPYFSAAGLLSASSLMALNGPILGGGAGGAPTSGSRSGNTTAFVTYLGSPVAGNCPQWDLNGNLTPGTSACGGGGGGGGITGSGIAGQVAEFSTATALTSRAYASTTAGTANAVLRTGTFKEVFAYDRGAQVYHCSAFGVVADGTTDDLAALQSCRDALPLSGGIMRLPCGDIAISDTLELGNGTRAGSNSTRYGVTIEGCGRGSENTITGNGNGIQGGTRLRASATAFANLTTITITNITNTTPIQITAPSHGLFDQDILLVDQAGRNGGCGNDNGANGTWTAHVINSNVIELMGSTGNGSWTVGCPGILYFGHPVLRLAGPVLNMRVRNLQIYGNAGNSGSLTGTLATSHVASVGIEWRHSADSELENVGIARSAILGLDLRTSNVPFGTAAYFNCNSRFTQLSIFSAQHQRTSGLRMAGNDITGGSDTCSNKLIGVNLNYGGGAGSYGVGEEFADNNRFIHAQIAGSFGSGSDWRSVRQTVNPFMPKAQVCDTCFIGSYSGQVGTSGGALWLPNFPRQEGLLPIDTGSTGPTLGFTDTGVFFGGMGAQREVTDENATTWYLNQNSGGQNGAGVLDFRRAGVTRARIKAQFFNGITFEFDTGSSGTSIVPMAQILPDGRFGVKTLAAATSGNLCANTGVVAGFNFVAACTSLAKYKTDVQPFAALAIVNGLEPISYTSLTNGRSELGLIAEAVETVDRRLSTYGADGNLIGVDYGHVGVVAIQAIKELEARIRALETRVLTFTQAQ